MKVNNQHLIAAPVTTENLIIKVEELSAKGYVFRGQPKSEYKLIPRIFRNDEIAKLYQDFLLKANVDARKWDASHPQVVKIINDWANGILIINGAKEMINRLTRLIIFKMIYNHNLAIYFQTLPKNMQDSYAPDTYFMAR